MKICWKYYSAVLFLTTCHGLRLLPQDNINSKQEYSSETPPITSTSSTPNTRDEPEEVVYNQSTTKENRAAELPSTKAEMGEDQDLQIKENKFESKILSSLNETNQLIREINSTLEEQKLEIRNITTTREIDSQRTSDLINQVQKLNNRTALWEQRHHAEINRHRNLSLHLAHAFNLYGSDSQQQQTPSQIQHTTPVPCNSDQFYCSEISSPKCIPRRYVCDGDNDCGNNQDERNCTKRCSSDEFACKNGTLITKCIPSRYVCDRDNDCGDFQDERNCNFTTTLCSGAQIACTNTGKCISSGRLCDRVDDCGDKEDEKLCTRNNGTASCPYNLYSCPNSQSCISRTLLCDGNDDCGNNEDERNCEILSQDYYCRGENELIKSSWVCDGDDDCEDNEDEQNCFKNSTSCKTDDMFICPGTDKCFHYRVVCNGKDDCGNGFDESACLKSLSNVTDLTEPGLSTLPEQKKNCRPDQFSCYGANTTKCISDRSDCDGNNNCGDFEDESNCTKIKIRRCHSADFVCHNGAEITKCLHMSSLCDGTEDCGDGQDELNCNYNNHTCPVGQIGCPGVRRCVDIHKLCDRRNDCGKNQDEDMCTRNGSSPCPLTLFSCPNSDKCISRSLICDGNNDCGNNEDEQDCGDEANRNRFVCVGTGRVIGKSWLCDGVDDCGNNADESNCNNSSTSCNNQNLFHCEGSENCISHGLICNGKKECRNGDDEQFCGGNLLNVFQLRKPGLPALDEIKTLCIPGEFLCPGLNVTKCIPERFVCNGITNCGNKADEGNCTQLQCGRNRIACSDGSKCVPYEEICDRQNDCRNKYDESLCTRNSTTCPYEMFTCKNSNRCISPRLVCDGNKDCEDNEDEEDCRGVCNEMQFQCPGTRKCISKYQLCDGKGHCEDNEDESNCNANSTLCSNGMFLCESSGQCISQRLVCNGFNDCLNNEDERYCLNSEDQLPKLLSPGLPQLKPSELGCLPDEFYCPKLNTIKCISKELVCDGNNDCGNEEDETNCQKKCFVGQFFCKGKKKCIPVEYVCDGESDCLNDEDETGCPQGTNSSSDSSSHLGCPTYEKNGILNIPSGQLVAGGSEFSYNKGTTLYICRAFYKGNYIPGKYHMRRKSCHFTWEEKEHSRTSDFEVMNWKTGNSTLKWVKQAVGVPGGVVEGGRTAEGDKLYVVRCKVKGEEEEHAWVPGRYDTRTEGAFVGHDLEQLACNEYFEFLTCA